MVLGLGEGRIEITLDKATYSVGDTIKGKAVLILKKPLEARGLRVEFVALAPNVTGGLQEVTSTLNILRFGSKRIYQNGEEFDFSFPLTEKSTGCSFPLTEKYAGLYYTITAILDLPLKIDIMKITELRINLSHQ